MADDQFKHTLDPERHEKIFQTRVVPEVFSNHQPQEKPTAIFLGGQPGAGKSQTFAAAVKEFDAKGGIVQIAGDDLRQFHPKFSELMRTDDKNMAFYTQVDAGRWVEKALDHAAQNKYNVVFETTMRTPDAVAPLLQKFQDAGFSVDARMLAVNPNLSELGIMQRYVSQVDRDGFGRMVPPEIHKAALSGMLGSADRIQDERLANSVTVYRRGNEEIRTFDLNLPRQQDTARISMVIQNERDRFMNANERQAFLDGALKVQQSAERNPLITQDVKDRIAQSVLTAQLIDKAGRFMENDPRTNLKDPQFRNAELNVIEANRNAKAAYPNNPEKVHQITAASKADMAGKLMRDEPIKAPPSKQADREK